MMGMNTLRGTYGIAAAMLLATSLALALCVQAGSAFAANQESLGGDAAAAEAHGISAAGSKLPKAKASKKAVRRLYADVLDEAGRGKYALFDVDGNGTKELLVGQGGRYETPSWHVYTVSNGKLKRLKPRLWGSPRSKGKELYLVAEIEYGNDIYKLRLESGKVKKKLAVKMTVKFVGGENDYPVWSGVEQYKRFRSTLTPLKTSPVEKRSLLKKL